MKNFDHRIRHKTSSMPSQYNGPSVVSLDVALLQATNQKLLFKSEPDVLLT